MATSETNLEIVDKLTKRALSLIERPGSKPIGHIVARKNLRDLCLAIGYEGGELVEDVAVNKNKRLRLNNDIHIFYYDNRSQELTLSVNITKPVPFDKNPKNITENEWRLITQHQKAYEIVESLLGGLGFDMGLEGKIVSGYYREWSEITYKTPGSDEKYDSAIAVPAAVSVIKNLVNQHGRQVMADKAFTMPR